MNVLPYQASCSGDVLPLSQRMYVFRGDRSSMSLLLTGPPQCYMESLRIHESCTHIPGAPGVILDALEQHGIREMNLTVLRSVPNASSNCHIKWAVEFYQVPAYNADITTSSPHCYQEVIRREDLPWTPVIYVTTTPPPIACYKKLEVICMHRFYRKRQTKICTTLPHQLLNGEPLYKTPEFQKIVLKRMQMIESLGDTPFARLAKMRLSMELLFDPWDIKNKTLLENGNEVSINKCDSFYVALTGDVYRHTVQPTGYGVCEYIKIPYETRSPCNTVPRIIHLSRREIDYTFGKRLYLDLCQVFEVETDVRNLISGVNQHNGLNIYKGLHDTNGVTNLNPELITHHVARVNAMISPLKRYHLFGTEVAPKFTTEELNIIDEFSRHLGTADGRSSSNSPRSVSPESYRGRSASSCFKQENSFLLDVPKPRCYTHTSHQGSSEMEYKDKKDTEVDIGKDMTEKTEKEGELKLSRVRRRKLSSSNRRVHTRARLSTAI